MIVSEQLNYIKTRRFHAIFMSVIIEFSRCIGTYSSAKFEFLISFQECEVLTDNLEKLLPVQVVRLNWEVLPKGEYPWSKMRENLERMSVRKGKTARQMMMDKCEYINSFHPDFRAYGKSGFSGYVIFGFQDRNLYVLESVYPNNATYVFGTDWEELSKLSKAEILNDNLQNARLIHHDNWQKEIIELLGA